MLLVDPFDQIIQALDRSVRHRDRCQLVIWVAQWAMVSPSPRVSGGSDRSWRSPDRWWMNSVASFRVRDLVDVPDDFVCVPGDPYLSVGVTSPQQPSDTVLAEVIHTFMDHDQQPADRSR